MTDIGSRAPADSNPFSTRYFRPGALDYDFPPDASAERLVRRFRIQGGLGQIVGPHGSGKTTLLHALVPLLVADGWRVEPVGADPAMTERPGPTSGPPDDRRRELTIIDGFDQLGWCRRARSVRRCRSRRRGLLVTAHRDLGLPTLIRLSPTPELAEQIVRRLLTGRESRVGREDVLASYRAAGGNLREMLFRLYDLHEARGSRLEA